jgi:hypothetical protein
VRTAAAGPKPAFRCCVARGAAQSGQPQACAEPPASAAVRGGVRVALEQPVFPSRQNPQKMLF